jgi:hypothetical protein
VGLDLAQIERYVLSGEPLLLVRIMTGQVKLLKTDPILSRIREITNQGPLQGDLTDKPRLNPRKVVRRSGG